ncbi:MAG: tripartite tricarboxylate transporter TctB family protein [Bilophila sp.]
MTERQRDMLAYGVVALAGGTLLLWIIPAYTPEYPGYGVPASLLPDLAAGFMLALSLLGLVRAVLASRAERRENGAAPDQGPAHTALGNAATASEGGPAGSAVACSDASTRTATGEAATAGGKAEDGTAAVQGVDGAMRSAEAEEAEKTEADPLPAASRIQWLHLARFLIPCALLMPAMSWIGFIPAGVAFMAVIQYFCGQRRPLAFALVAALPVLTVYAVMRFGLGVPMP